MVFFTGLGVSSASDLLMFVAVSAKEKGEVQQTNSQRSQQRRNLNTNLVGWDPLSMSSSLDTSIVEDLRARLFPLSFEVLAGDKENDSSSETRSILTREEPAALLLRG